VSPEPVVRLSRVFARLRQAGVRLAVGDAVELGLMLADAVLAAPGAHFGSAHPSLVLLTRSGSARVLDGRGDRFSFRRAGAASFEWWGPEVVSGSAPTVATDVWSIAVLTWSALTLASPFDGDEATVVAAIRGGTPAVALEDLRPDVSAPLARCLTSSLSPGAGPPSVEALQDQLRSFRGREPSLAARARLVDWCFQLAPPPPRGVAPPGADARLLAAIASGDESARLVYADVLEERGLVDHARWVRLESAVQQAEGARRLELVGELAVLREVVGRDFLATIARPALEGCPVRFGFRCPLRWESLERTAVAHVRHCAACDSTVEYFDSLEAAQRAAVRGQCVAVDVSVTRYEADLLEAPRPMVGRLA
jgi:uncharacterized protein (TIGR02996 family)